MIQIYSAISMYGGRPTDSQIIFIRTLKSRLNKVERDFNSFVGKDLVKVNRFLKNYKVGEISISSEKNKN